jgi:NTP pyrophosphatase (non-canonical NTP hydrolase)
MKDLENEIREYLAERKWDKLRPGDLAKSVAIEAGELLELFQWDNPSLDEVRADPERLAEIRKELADVLLYCIDMAVLLDFDTAQIVKDKLAKAKQKYPAELFKDRADGTDAGTEDIYWQIKREHRQKGTS